MSKPSVPKKRSFKNSEHFQKFRSWKYFEHFQCSKPNFMCFLLQVGQRQGGLLHLLQSSLDRATAHVWFERSEVNDRLAVARRLREHIEDKEKLPILIFPEGKIHHQIFLRQRFSTSISYLTFSESKRIASSASEISCLMRSIFHGKTFSYIFHQKL